MQSFPRSGQRQSVFNGWLVRKGIGW